MYWCKYGYRPTKRLFLSKLRRYWNPVKIMLPTFCLVAFLTIPAAHGAGISDLLKAFPSTSASGSLQRNDTLASGLKEALSVGTKNAVNLLSKKDGYFGNEAVKILLPENIRKAGDFLRLVGYQEEVDAFILSMNRAAEKAAPQAVDIFADAIKSISFEDARKIYNGGNTAATQYFKEKTSSKLAAAFRPEISKSMDQVGVTKAYKDMVGRYTALVPFGSVESLNLDNYVTNKALEGLFYELGQEEAKIRANPAARTTELLRKVFGK